MKKNFLKIFIFFILIFLTPKVYASEFNMNSHTSATKGGTKNRYNATEIYQTGGNFTYTFNTRYNGRISYIKTFFDYPFESNTTYRLTYNMATDDFRNNFGYAYWWDCDDSTQVNPYRSSITYVSYKKIQVSFKPTENTTCIRMDIQSTNVSSVAITGVSNWNLSNITLYDPAWQSGSGSGQGSSSPTPTPTSGASNQDIINNQNNNTQDIINNTNQNTSDIIENNNENTNKIVDTIEKKCTNLLDSKNYSLSSGIDTNSLVATENGITITGITNATASNYLAYYLTVSPNTDYHLSVENNINKFIVFTTNYNTVARANEGTNSLSFNSGSNETLYFLFYANGTNATTFNKIMLSKDNTPFCVFGSSSNRLDEFNNSINNDNIDSGVGSDFFDDFNNNMHGLSSIITIPLSSIQALSSAICSPLHIPIPFTNNKYLDLPCMTTIYEQHIPTLLTLIQTCWYGILAYKIVVDIFYIVKGFKDPDSDKIEVLDL